MGIFAEEGERFWIGALAAMMVWSPLGTTFASWFSEALVVLECILYQFGSRRFRRRGIIHGAIARAVYM
jgi:hypothetical protein